jgi:hypothetical protein
MSTTELARMALAVMEWPGQERCTTFQFRPLHEEALVVLVMVGPVLAGITFDIPTGRPAIWRGLDDTFHAAIAQLSAGAGTSPGPARGEPSIN